MTSPTLGNHVGRFPSDTHSCCLHILKSTGPKWQTVLLRRCLELACTLKSVSLVSQEDLRATSSQISNTSGKPELAPSLPNWEGLSLREHHCHKERLLLPWAPFPLSRSLARGTPFPIRVKDSKSEKQRQLYL